MLFLPTGKPIVRLIIRVTCRENEYFLNVHRLGDIHPACKRRRHRRMRSEGPAYHAEPSELLAETKGSHVHASVAPATHSGTWKKGRGKMSDLENPVPYQHTLCVKAVVSLQRSTMPHAKSDGLLLQRSVYSHATISFNSFTL